MADKWPGEGAAWPGEQKGPTIGALPAAEAAHMHAADAAENKVNDEKYAPKLYDDTPLGGLDNGADAAAGNIARLVRDGITVPSAPLLAQGIAGAGLPAGLARGATAVGIAGAGAGADYGLAKAGVPAGTREVLSLIPTLMGIKSMAGAVPMTAGTDVEAGKEASPYMSRLVDSFKKAFGRQNLGDTAANADTLTTPSALDSTPDPTMMEKLDAIRAQMRQALPKGSAGFKVPTSTAPIEPSDPVESANVLQKLAALRDGGPELPPSGLFSPAGESLPASGMGGAARPDIGSTRWTPKSMIAGSAEEADMLRQEIDHQKLLSITAKSAQESAAALKEAARLEKQLTTVGRQAARWAGRAGTQ